MQTTSIAWADYSWTPELIHRFVRKFDRGDGSECWEWTAWTKNEGYGRFALERGVHPYAHRLSYQLPIGPIPVGLQINHHCDNKACVNPAHLYAGTHQDNIDDAKERLGFLEERRGENSHTAKLTAEEVVEIRERYATEDISHRELGAEYGVSHTAIGAIIRCEKWSHIQHQGAES